MKLLCKFRKHKWDYHDLALVALKNGDEKLARKRWFNWFSRTCLSCNKTQEMNRVEYLREILR